MSFPQARMGAQAPCSPFFILTGPAVGAHFSPGVASGHGDPGAANQHLLCDSRSTNRCRSPLLALLLGDRETGMGSQQILSYFCIPSVTLGHQGQGATGDQEPLISQDSCFR